MADKYILCSLGSVRSLVLADATIILLTFCGFFFGVLKNYIRFIYILF